MTDSLEITPAPGPVRGTIRPPGSKSITNRALVCAALAEGESTLRGALDSEDTWMMIAALGELGIQVDVADEGRTLRVAGCGGSIPAKKAELFVGNSGTTMRFLTALATLGHGEYRLDGIARMRERPIGDLADALNGLGGSVECLGANRCPPVVVRGGGLQGGQVSIRGDVSSQFLSGLMMAAPYAQQNVVVTVQSELVSKPYVWMTEGVMEAFGGCAVQELDGTISVFNDQRYQGREYDIEPDASAASYFFAAAAILGGSFSVEWQSSDTLQGDWRFCECLQRMGAEYRLWLDSGKFAITGRSLQGIDVDMNDISDTVQTLAVVALFADGPTRIRNVAHIRHKETDRIAATATELRKFGAEVKEFEDGLLIRPPTVLHGAQVDTYNDHRMAMSFALTGLKIPGVVINDPGCTKKTYPRFFADLESLVRGVG